MNTLNKILLLIAVIAFILSWIFEQPLSFFIGLFALVLMYFFADDDYDQYEGV